MRKFIVSDLHGSGEVYDSIIAYLENIALTDDVELYINGDLIDRGLASFRMLEDVIERIDGKGNIKIHYLGGNHELMMYQALEKRRPNGTFNFWCDWLNNGGCIIEGELEAREDGIEKGNEFKEFLSGLEIYHKFPEIIDDNQLLLVHAQAPKEVLDNCNMKIGDDNKRVNDAVWTREEIRDNLLFFVGDILGYKVIGKEGYLTIIGHTPIKNPSGFKYNKKNNYLNIDGGCAAYAVGHFEYDHVPLVEVLDDRLALIIFNHNNEIIDGYSFDGEIVKMDHDELDKRKKYIDHSYDGKGENAMRLIKEYLEY